VSVEALVPHVLDGNDVARLRSRWWERAACRGEDPDLFFPTRGETDKVEAAKAVCADCSVRADCLEEGLYEHDGIWGGLSERGRRAERRRRQRARTTP
jgi:WhiB family transcriptional regulator, redox-sensing transcriptional regulator